MATIDQLNWWTEERVAELKRRWANSETFTAIAAAMRATSRSAVIGKAHRLKLIRPATYVKASRNTNGHARRRRHDRQPIIRIAKGDEVTELPPPIFANPVRFIDLKVNDCRWPGAGQPGPNMPCCAAPALPGKSYCLIHCRIAYNPPSRPRL